MSKEGFSEKVSELIGEKNNPIENFNTNIFFENNEYFELIMCLAYMTLSKEKIIKKDMKNPSRLDRLTRMVDEKEIDKVFQPGFANEMPNIIYTKELDNTWILDNIRDSIMHGAFNIDENKKCFIINNTQFDRELNAEIPFSWFIAYARNNIMKSKKLDKFTVRGFYYNKNKKDRKFLISQKEVINNILYNVNIDNNNFNIKDIETRIKEILEEYSKKTIDDVEIEKYRMRIDSEKIKYNEKYLVSFYIASSMVKEKIEKEFPGIKVDIKIDNRKYKLANKFSKDLSTYYKNYDLLYENLNQFVKPKSISLLNYLSTIIENLNNVKNVDYVSLNKYQQMNLVNYILTGENIEYKNSVDSYIRYNNNLKILRSIYLSIITLSTLVINHENLYSTIFSSEEPSKYGIIAYSHQSYLDYANKEKNIVMQILEKEIKLFEKKEQLKKCPVEKGKIQINNTIQTLEEEISSLKQNLDKLTTTTGFKPYIDYRQYDQEKLHKIKEIISIYFHHFQSATSKEEKRKIRKVIGKFFEIKIEEESKYAFSYCNTMDEVLTIIRNSFSHIGRIDVSMNYGMDTMLILNDYDNDNQKSGAVIIKYKDLANLLRTPFIEEGKVKKIKSLV